MTCEECGSPFIGSHFGDCRVATGMTREPVVFQHYWRCAHHSSSLENFFDYRTACEWGCHKQALSWHHNGEHPLSESAPRAANDD
jgi:hypothetical protein